MEKKISKIMHLIFTLIFFVAVGSAARAEYVSASSASISVTTESNKVAKGDTIYVTIQVKSTDLIGGFKGCFTYDSSVLKYITGGSVMSGNDDEFYLTDTDRDTGVKSIKYVVKFKARHKGNVSIRLKKPYSIYASEDSSEMSVAYNSLNIMVVDKKDIEKEEAEKKANEVNKDTQASADDNQEENKTGNSSDDGTQEKDKTGDSSDDGTQEKDKTGDLSDDGTQEENKIGNLSDDGSQEMDKSTDEADMTGSDPANASDKKNESDSTLTDDSMKYIVISGIMILAVLIIIFTCIISHTYKKYGEELADEEEDDDITDLPSGSSWKR